MNRRSSQRRPRIAILTAGGAGMFCGSCMHDNTWARALHSADFDVSLIPAYTPIRVDEEDVSSRQVFFGGINVWLNSRWAWWRGIPGGWKRWLDHPAVIRFLTRWGLSTEAHELGAITIAMLNGEEGPHRAAIDDLADFLRRLQPDVVLFTNALLAGALRRLRDANSARFLCILQGDDIFLEGLIEPYKSQVLGLVRSRAEEFDGFVVQSRYYRDFMAEYLSLSPRRFHQVPLAIDCAKHDGRPKDRLGDPPVIGYFARVCEEKGLHRLIEACAILRRRGHRFRVLAGGYLAPERRIYLDRVRQAAAAANLDFTYVGSPDTHAEKVAFFKSIDLFSVPTVYREPKGLYVLEALANGVPAALPDHGAFPELIESTGGGVLFPAEDLNGLADVLAGLLNDPARRAALAESGWRRVREAHGMEALAAASEALFLGDRTVDDRQKVPAAAEPT